MRVGIITLTQGNLNNDHLYLTDIMELFPKSSVGGPSEAEQGGQLLEVHSGIAAPVNTDIADSRTQGRRQSHRRAYWRVQVSH
ncbi:MAG: hypothetical protein ACRESW_03275, partial [Nevskiales bacterium]